MKTKIVYFIENKFGKWLIHCDTWTTNPLEAKSFTSHEEAVGWKDYVWSTLENPRGKTITSEMVKESKIIEHEYR